VWRRSKAARSGLSRGIEDISTESPSWGRCWSIAGDDAELRNGGKAEHGNGEDETGDEAAAAEQQQGDEYDHAAAESDDVEMAQRCADDKSSEMGGQHGKCHGSQDRSEKQQRAEPEGQRKQEEEAECGCHLEIRWRVGDSLERVAEHRLKRGLYLGILLLGDAALEPIGFKSEQLILQGLH
jgi:hypothetical protein